jgi:hypothetical protein
VDSSQIIVPWKSHKAFLKDEESAEHLGELNKRYAFESGSLTVALLVKVD